MFARTSAATACRNAAAAASCINGEDCHDGAPGKKVAGKLPAPRWACAQRAARACRAWHGERGGARAGVGNEKGHREREVDRKRGKTDIFVRVKVGVLITYTVYTLQLRRSCEIFLFKIEN